jgi:hypothetical protein
MLTVTDCRDGEVRAHALLSQSQAQLLVTGVGLRLLHETAVGRTALIHRKRKRPATGCEEMRGRDAAEDDGRGDDEEEEDAGISSLRGYPRPSSSCRSTL